MNKNIGVIGVAFVLGMILLVARFAREPIHAQEREKPAPAVQKWEYKIVILDNGRDLDPRNNGAAFNKLGAEGWELCTAHSSTRPEYCIFKRPLR